MERKIARLVGTLAGLATLGSTGAQAAGDTPAMPEALPVASYSDLLQPIPNAVEVLKAHNAELAAWARNTPAGIKRVQWYQRGGDHHHHHHHDYYPPPGYPPPVYAPPAAYAPPPPPVYYAPPPPPVYYHHHHHHSGGVIMLPGFGVQINGG